VIHLMISGRLQWAERSGKTPADAPSLKAIPKRNGLAAFDFDNGSLIFTEASRKKRASLKLIEGEEALQALNPGGLEVLEIDLATFTARIRDTNHTLKRALTDQRVFAGIGNAYSASGQTDCVTLRSGSGLKRSRRSIRRWPCMVSSKSPVGSAVLPCSALFTRRTKPITAHVARLAVDCWPTALCRAC